MSKAVENQMKKFDYQIQFKDSPEYFVVKNSKMIFETNVVRFLEFDNKDKFVANHWYPMSNVYRIKSY